MGDVQWIKLYVNTFNVSRKLKQIEQMKGGDTIIVVWIKLLCLAGSVNDGGMVYVTPEIPFTVEGLAEELRKPVKAIRHALETLARYKQIVMDDAGFIKISSWDKYQDLDRLNEIREQTRKRVAKCRENKKVRDGNATCNVTSNAFVTPCNDIEEEIEEDEEKEKEFHSFVLSRASEKDNSVTDRERVQRELMSGTLGGGVVMLSDEERSKLLDELSLDEFDRYVSIVRDCELKGQKFKRKTHYQAIMEMAMADRMKAVKPKKQTRTKLTAKSTSSTFDADEFYKANIRRTFGEDFDIDNC